MDEVTDNNQVNTVIDQSAGGGSISADHGINYFVLRTLTLLCVTFYVVAFSGIITVKPLVIIFGILGYASLPLLAFCSVEAFRHSTRLNSLIIRNIILAVLCAFPYRFAFYSQKSFST